MTTPRGLVLNHQVVALDPILTLTRRSGLYTEELPDAVLGMDDKVTDSQRQGIDALLSFSGKFAHVPSVRASTPRQILLGENGEVLRVHDKPGVTRSGNNRNHAHRIISGDIFNQPGNNVTFAQHLNNAATSPRSWHRNDEAPPTPCQ